MFIRVGFNEHNNKIEKKKVKQGTKKRVVKQNEEPWLTTKINHEYQNHDKKRH